MKFKICSKCNLNLPIGRFNDEPRNKSDGKTKICKDCKSAINIAYNRSKNGLLRKIYNQQKRSSRERGHPQPEYSFNELKEWCMSQEIFHNLHAAWEDDGFSKYSAPSIDRIDVNDHYRFDNLKLMTWMDNCEKGREERLGQIKSLNEKIQRLQERIKELEYKLGTR